MNPELEECLRAGGGVVQRRHVGRNLLEGAQRRGELVAVLPGVYAATDVPQTPAVKALALARTDPDAVITGRAAAALTWWPELSAPVVTAARRGKHAPAPGFAWSRRTIPIDQTREVGLCRTTTTALTVLDLIPDLGGKAIDEALRRRKATLPQLWSALAATPGRRGNDQRARLLHDSRDEPWSEPERAFHALLRAAGLTGWRTNRRLDFPEGDHAYLDVAIESLLLGFEVDGFEFHGGQAEFLRDRRRDARAAALGWHLVRFAAGDVEGWLTADSLRAIVTARAAALGGASP